MFVKYSHNMLYAKDLQRAVNFYNEKLGFSVAFHIPNSFASLYHNEMKCRIDLHPSEADCKDVGFGAIIYFSTNDIIRDLAALKTKGISVTEPRREGSSPRFASFKDSEGNVLGLEEI